MAIDLKYRKLAQPFKGDFSNDDIDNYITVFKSFDRDGNGSIDARELKTAFAELGENIPDAELQAQIDEVDEDRSHTVEFNEFLQIIKNLKKGRSSAFGQAISKKADANRTAVQGAVGVHSFSEEEKMSFAEHINAVLGHDAVCQPRLPLNPGTSDLFTKTNDGVLLCKLINHAVPDTIDERVMNTRMGMNMFNMTENLNLVINSAKAIGCNVVNVGANDIIEGREHIILGLVWQIVRIGLLSQISLAYHPELFRLLDGGEEVNDLLKLSPETILLRWVNYHLAKAGHPKRIHNFAGDIKDSEAYTVLLTQLAPGICDRSPLAIADPVLRAEKMLEQAQKIDARKFVSAKDVAKGNPKLNLAFVANLFNTRPCLEPLSEQEKAALDEFLFSSEGTREARAFCLWINSLGIEPFVNNLFGDLRDGLVLLRVMDKIHPGLVDWTKVNKNTPMIKFKAIENCNYVLTLAKSLRFSLVGIGGQDINDGNQTLTLALVWQLMRLHVLTILKSLSRGGQDVNEDLMVRWANERVSAAGKGSHMDNFKDSSLRTSHFFLDLLDAIRNCVDYNLITPGASDPEALQNAKYAISIARKIGCTIFLLPEDIVEVKPKMIMTLIGSIMSVGLTA